MRLRDAKPGPVPLRPPASATFDREAGGAQRLEQRPAGGIDGGSVFQRTLGVRLDPRQNLRPPRKELLNRPRALFLVARNAGAGQIRNPVRSAASAWHDVIEVQRHIRCAAVGAGVIPFREEIFTDLSSSECAALIFRALDFRVLHRLHIEAHKLHRDAGDRREAAQARDPA